MPWKPVAEATAVVPTATIPPPAAGVSSRSVSDLERTTENQETRIAAAELELVSLDGRLGTAETDILALEAADVALDGRLGTAEADIDALEAFQAAATAVLVDHDARIVDLEAEDVALDARLDVLEAVNRRVIEVNDATAGLRITQNGSGNALVVEDSTNPDATPLVVDNSGQLGLGIAAPISTVDISRDGVAQFTFGRHSSDGNPARFAARKSQGTRAAPALVAANSLLFEYAFRGYDGVDYRDAALILGAVQGTPAAGSMPGLLSFRTTPSGSTTPVEHMRILSTGLTAFSVKFGYGLGVGNGGQVVQATSKATAVTLNTSTGQITTFNNALGAGARVSFIVNNTLCELNDSIIIHRKNGGTPASYRVWIDEVATGAFRVTLENYSAVSLSEAVVLQYSIVRGVIA